MKRRCTILILLVQTILSVNTFGQEITPRGESYIADELFCDKWCYQDGDENLRFFTLAEGDMWAFKMSGTDENNYALRSYVYKYSPEAEKYEFNFVEKIIDIENNKYTYPCVAFSVNGSNYVYAYYKSTEDKPMENACDYKPYYYRLFYQANPPEGEWLTSLGPIEMENGPEHDTDPNKPVYRSAFVEGNKVYLMYDSYINVYKEHVGIIACPTSGYDYNTEVVYYSDNSVYVDICEITSDNNLKRLERKRIENVMHSSDQHPQHLSGMRMGEDMVLLLSYDGGYTDEHLHKGGGVLAYNITEGKKIEDRYFASARILRAVAGSIQGENETEVFGNKAQPARFQVFFNHFDDETPDQVKHFVKTFAVTEEDGEYDVVEQSENSRQIVGLSNVGDGWGDLMMDVAVKRVANDESDQVPGNETVRQDIYLFRNDADKKARVQRFNSDYFTINFSDTSYIESRNFGPSYNEYYEGMNRKLWTLVGIYEGAPPMPMNWQRYKDHFPSKNATGISFSNESENILSMTQESDFSIYGKIGAQFGEETVYGSVKGTRNWINSHTISHSVNYAQDISSALNNGSMGNAVFLWSVPNLARADMSGFPWWADDDLQKIPGSETSVIWHLAPNNNLVFEVVDMGDEVYQALFGINSDSYYPLSHEDSLNMQGGYRGSAALDTLTFERWCDQWTINNPSRMRLSEKAQDHPQTRILDFVWDANGTEATSSFSQTDVESSTKGGANNLEITVGANIGNAKVFSVNLEVGSSITFSNETAKEFSTSSGYKLFTDKALEGTLITDEFIALTERLALSCYLFNNPAEDYWYYDILNENLGSTYPEFKNQKPWYLGYVANRPTPYINDQITSAENTQLIELSPIRYTADHSSVLITYSIAQALHSNSTIYIIDVMGRHVKQLPLSFDPGTHSIHWNFTGEHNSKVPQGVYFVVMNINGCQKGEPIIVL